MTDNVETTKMTFAEMLDHRDILAEREKSIKAEKLQFAEAIKAKVLPIAQEGLRKVGKDFGTVDVVVEGVAIKCTIAKKTEWDQDMLLEAEVMIAQTTNMDPSAIIDVKRSVKETVFKDIENPEIRAHLTAARTLSINSVTIKRGSK